MKQFFSVIATLICLHLTLGFKTASIGTTVEKTGRLHQQKAVTWKNSSWVNPWADMKIANIQQRLLANNIVVVNWTNLNILEQCKLTQWW